MKFDEVLKQLEPSMAVPMYPKALLIDFMRKAYDEGFKDCAKARLNVTTISDCPIKFEWHYVKDELPTNTDLYLIYYKDAFFDINVRTIARYSPDRKEFLNINIEDGDDVIAWCELPVPPEEIK